MSTKADASVAAFVAALDHPLKKEVVAVRDLLLGADPSIGEGIKWNAPSFRTTEYFATMHLRSQEALQLVFHLGAKARPDVAKMEIADPAGLLKWLAKDRALVTLGARDDVQKNAPAFQALVRAWITHVR